MLVQFIQFFNQAIDQSAFLLNLLTQHQTVLMDWILNYMTEFLSLKDNFYLNRKLLFIDVTELAKKRKFPKTCYVHYMARTFSLDQQRSLTEWIRDHKFVVLALSALILFPLFIFKINVLSWFLACIYNRSMYLGVCFFLRICRCYGSNLFLDLIFLN